VHSSSKEQEDKNRIAYRWLLLGGIDYLEKNKLILACHLLSGGIRYSSCPPDAISFDRAGGELLEWIVLCFEQFYAFENTFFIHQLVSNKFMHNA